MKLLFCPECYSVFNLAFKEKFCTCRASSGKYMQDGLNAEVYGKGIPLGFHNTKFVQALKKRPKKGNGSRFLAFVIPNECPTVKEFK